MRAFCGFSSSEAMKPSLSSSSSTLRPTTPVGTRLLRTTTTPFFTAAAAASTDPLFMLPLPTPAMTRPFTAPPATSVVMISGDMSRQAKMMSTRGSFVTLVTSNSLCVVCFHGGGARLGERVCAMDLIVHHDQDAAPPGLGIRGHRDGVVEVERAIGAHRGRWPHGAHQHDRLVGLRRQVEEIGGLFHGVRAMGDHDAIDIALGGQLVDPLGELQQDVERHVL